MIKAGTNQQDVWFTELGNIKEIIVRIGFVDKLFGTGSIYPITPEYPYAPQPRAYSRGGMNNLKKTYNIVKGEYEMVAEIELYRTVQSHPHIQAIKEPYALQKLLRETIWEAETNYVDCEYCHYRYDLNKTGKCPNCGATKKQKT